MPHENKVQVSSEIGTLQRLLIHSPDSGIGKVIPNKFKELLYDDTVFLKQMRREYNTYIKLLLYFLDSEKLQYVLDCEKKHTGNDQPDCYKPDKEVYFKSEKVLDTQYLLSKVLQSSDCKERLIAAVCATEGCSYEIEKELANVHNTHELAKILISGVMHRHGKSEFIFQPLPNFIFTRDISIIVNDHLLLGKAANDAREREMLIMRFIAYHELFKECQEKVVEINESSNFFLLDEEEQRQRKTSLEGGDIMMIAPNHLLIGYSERTSPNAVNKIIHAFFSNSATGIEKISVVKIPRQRSVMHIDTVFTHVRKDVWVLFGKFSEQLIHIKNKRKYSYYEVLHDEDQQEYEDVEIFRFYKPLAEQYDASKNYRQNIKLSGIEALLKNISAEDYGIAENDVKIIYSGNNIFPYDEREQWSDSCNLLALKNGVCIAYDRNEETLNAFRQNGFSVVQAEDLFKQFEQKIITPQSIENTIITLSSSELSRARGGAHCMSLPLLRQKI